MATVAKDLITAEEFAQMPDPADGSIQEFVRGKIVSVPPPMGPHGICCAKADRRVGNFVADHHLGILACNYTGFILERDPDTVRGPDISFWRTDRLTDMPTDRYVDISPDLIVEVLSPRDYFSYVQRKIRGYLTAGVRLVWVIDPENREVTVYRSGRDPVALGENDTLSGEDVLPGFTCRVAELLP